MPGSRSRQSGLRTGFSPIADRRAEVLILGSFPSERSLAAHQYYAHPRNGFWPVMGRVLGTRLDVPYAKRKQILKENRVALWDVVAAARRPGSLDSSIIGTSVVVNDFRRFFRAHPRLRLVCFNGGKAAELFRRLVFPKPNPEHAKIRYRRLPSTSPAHAALPFGRKVARWRVVGRALSGGVSRRVPEISRHAPVAAATPGPRTAAACPKHRGSS